MFKAIGQNPPILVLFAAVGFGVSIAAYTGSHFFRHDPTLLLTDKKANPHRWNQIDQGTQIKLYAVNQKFDKSIKKGYREDL
ncbi:UNVERIFIED_CONTAM: hypothetical protein HDU68_008871 [Siphonaria sp. JEL0065]|nr:hypothetical protein HDU68_008871 [Siphonaria sp. JEL0065]